MKREQISKSNSTRKFRPAAFAAQPRCGALPTVLRIEQAVEHREEACAVRQEMIGTTRTARAEHAQTSDVVRCQANGLGPHPNRPVGAKVCSSGQSGKCCAQPECCRVCPGADVSRSRIFGAHFGTTLVCLRSNPVTPDFEHTKRHSRGRSRFRAVNAKLRGKGTQP